MSARQVANAAGAQFLKIGERLGVPAAVVFLMFAFAGVTSYFICVDVLLPITRKHIEFVDKVESTNATSVETQRIGAETQAKSAETQRRMADSLEGIKDLIKSQKDAEKLDAAWRDAHSNGVTATEQ